MKDAMDPNGRLFAFLVQKGWTPFFPNVWSQSKIMLQQVIQWWKIPKHNWNKQCHPKNQTSLGGGFKYFLFHPDLGKWSNLTNIFEIGWNHQLELTVTNSLRPTVWISFDGTHPSQVLSMVVAFLSNAVLGPGDSDISVGIWGYERNTLDVLQVYRYTEN